MTMGASSVRTHVVRMNDDLETSVRIVAIGVLATLIMDLWALALRRIGIPSLDLALLGRWVGHMRLGRWRHESIARATPVRGERQMGWIAHYAIGISFAVLLVTAFGLGWARAPSLAPALIVGLATVAAPLFVLQPAIGAGIASSKTARPVFNATKSVVTHIVYGLGLYLAASVTSLVQ
jgi:hypothetical protein